MTGSDRATVHLKRLIQLLEQERAMLLSGDFVRLETVAGALGRELDKLQALSVDATSEHERLLTSLTRLAGRNLALAEGSRRGVQAAARRIGEVSGEMAGLTTYSRDGDRTVLANRKSRRDHRT